MNLEVMVPGGKFHEIQLLDATAIVHKTTPSHSQGAPEWRSAFSDRQGMP
jgi:hypothetical protein